MPDQILSSEQYTKIDATKLGSYDWVEFAIRFPARHQVLTLPGFRSMQDFHNKIIKGLLTAGQANVTLVE